MSLSQSTVEFLYTDVKDNKDNISIGVECSKLHGKTIFVCRYNSNGKHPIYLCSNIEARYIELLLEKDNTTELTFTKQSLIYGEHVKDFKMDASDLMYSYRNAK